MVEKRQFALGDTVVQKMHVLYLANENPISETFKYICTITYTYIYSLDV